MNHEQAALIRPTTQKIIMAEKGKKRKKLNPPRRKTMKRPARLQAARSWMVGYQGKNLIRGYGVWFGVDLTCALKELALLGVALDPEQVARMRVSEANRLAEARRRREARAARRAHEPDPLGVYGEDHDEDFAFIAGYTSGGVAFGVTWEEEGLDALEDPLAASDDAVFDWPWEE